MFRRTMVLLLLLLAGVAAAPAHAVHTSANILIVNPTGSGYLFPNQDYDVIQGNDRPLAGLEALNDQDVFGDEYLWAYLGSSDDINFGPFTSTATGTEGTTSFKDTITVPFVIALDTGSLADRRTNQWGLYYFENSERENNTVPFDLEYYTVNYDVGAHHLSLYLPQPVAVDVPEPATLVLLCLGGILLAFGRRSKALAMLAVVGLLAMPPTSQAAHMKTTTGPLVVGTKVLSQRRTLTLTAQEAIDRWTPIIEDGWDVDYLGSTLDGTTFGSFSFADNQGTFGLGQPLPDDTHFVVLLEASVTTFGTAQYALAYEFHPSDWNWDREDFTSFDFSTSFEFPPGNKVRSMSLFTATVNNPAVMVPEPATFLLLGLGASSLLFIRRSRA